MTPRMVNSRIAALCHGLRACGTGTCGARRYHRMS
jgi:hypothetical protein